MEMDRFLQLCEQAAKFGGRDLKVWVGGGPLDGARPLVEMRQSDDGVLLCWGEDVVDGADPSLTLRSLINKMGGAGADRDGAAGNGCVLCTARSGAMGYYPVAEACPSVQDDGEGRVIFRLVSAE